MALEFSFDTPYEAERFEIGDESNDGESGRQLGLESRSVNGSGLSTGSETSSLDRILLLERASSRRSSRTGFCSSSRRGSTTSIF